LTRWIGEVHGRGTIQAISLARRPPAATQFHYSPPAVPLQVRNVPSAECGMRSAECGMRNAECGGRSVPNAECGTWNAELLSLRTPHSELRTRNTCSCTVSPRMAQCFQELTACTCFPPVLAGEDSVTR
jgi:hypothetical protein